MSSTPHSSTGQQQRTFWGKVLDIITVIISAVLLIVATQWAGGFFNKSTDGNLPIENHQTQVIQVPISDAPPKDVGEEPENKPTVVDLLKEPYQPSADPYGSSYFLEAIRLTIGGDFESVKVNIQGETIGKGYRFLSFNFGQASGVLNAVRKTSNALDLSQTILKGGAYNENNPINTSIDLLKQEEVATSKVDYSSTLQGSAKIKFWDEMMIHPPTVTTLLVAPFTQSGSYGGAIIKSIRIENTCKDKSSCEISVCPQGQKTTQCIKEALGEEAMQKWCKESKKC